MGPAPPATRPSYCVEVHCVPLILLRYYYWQILGILTLEVPRYWVALHRHPSPTPCTPTSSAPRLPAFLFPFPVGTRPLESRLWKFGSSHTPSLPLRSPIPAAGARAHATAAILGTAVCVYCFDCVLARFLTLRRQAGPVLRCVCLCAAGHMRLGARSKQWGVGANSGRRTSQAGWASALQQGARRRRANTPARPRGDDRLTRSARGGEVAWRLAAPPRRLDATARWRCVVCPHPSLGPPRGFGGSSQPPAAPPWGGRGAPK
jgi:hypothetical protein